MIKVTNLSKIFRTEEIETTALNGVSFEIKQGEFVAIMGPSGCGKSTLLNILGLLDNPTGGKWIFVLTGNNRAVRRDIRIGRQNPQFYEVLEGLQPGERVITSSYDNFGDNDVLIF